MNISIIIVSWNVRDLLKKCLESIFAHTKENTPARGVLSWNSDKSVSGVSEASHLATSIANPKYLSSAAQMDGTGLEPVFSKVTNLEAYQLAEPPKGAANNIIPQFEIIVIDNASSDGTVEMLEQNFCVVSSPTRNPLYDDVKENKGPLPRACPEYPRGVEATKKVTLIVNPKNRGFAAANNQGIKEAKGEYILLLNPDTEFIENSLEKVIAKMKPDNKIGVLGCRLLNPDKTIQPSVRRFPTVWSQLVILFKLHKLFPWLLDNYLAKDLFEKFGSPKPSPYPLPGRERGLYEVDQVMGAFFCVRKALFDKIGLLDDGYFIWFEEVDFCRRVKASGYKMVYWPGTSIVHYGGQSFAQQMTLKKQLWFFKSAWRYFTK